MPALPTLCALALLAAAPGAAPAPAPAVPAPAPAPAGGPEAGPLGRRYHLERIELRGLTHTREAEVRRHLLVAPGDVLDTERVLLSRLRLLQLGWFSRVETRVERGSERGLVVLVIEVTERNTLIVSDLVFGSTGPQPFYGGLGLSQQNFLGRGMGLSGAFVYGGSPSGRSDDPSRFALRGGFFAPDLTPRRLPPLVFGVSGQFLRGEELTCDDPDCEAYRSDYGRAPRIRYQRAAGEVTLGMRPGPFERLLATYRYERLHAAAIDDSPALAAARGPGPAILVGWSDLSALTGTYEIDTRDDFFFPTDGFRGVAQVTFGSALLGGDYEYSRYLLQLETAYALLGRRLRLQLAAGAAQGSAPFFERFYAADWSYFTVGPALGRALELNFSTDSRYDAVLGMAGLEYAVPLWSRGGFFHRGYLAIGARGVWSAARPGGGRTAVSDLPFSADLALRLDTPVGTFNASLGYALDNFL
ncbi:surface antigen variable number repeat protein [Anaeromyxobacter sp. K]|uniref:BamA/TamA family outer membrane protein n=1 Tax=Anaeromyxobacter sp. (strain K) TaxID=447217 RepID=UPI00017BE252|nr:BamA/TamA family outer membrane protein [Anaeromyxobacter sp. K]ACG72365.1 surface antigen variable number repeat protein [Anaeromyxobacter sp. K]